MDRLAYACRSVLKGDQAEKKFARSIELSNPPAFRYYNIALANATKEV